MIEIEKVSVYGWEEAIRGMRNPMNSWEQSDSDWGLIEDESPINPCDEPFFFVGEKDLDLMKRLCKAGSDHRKYLRMITVYADITAPLYWWKEFDTYKVGTVSNSCSTMHKIHAKKFTIDDFSYEHLTDSGCCLLEETIQRMNFWRLCFLEQRNPETYNADCISAKECWWQMIQLLPSSYNQKRTVMLNYEVLRNMYFARRNHKLDEWHTLCDWIETLPYFEEVCIDE